MNTCWVFWGHIFWAIRWVLAFFCFSLPWFWKHKCPEVACGLFYLLCLGVHVTFSSHIKLLLYAYWESSFRLCLVKSNLTRAYINGNINEIHWLDVPKSGHIQSLAFFSLTHSCPWVSMLYRLWAIRNVGETAYFKITHFKKGHWCWALSRLSVHCCYCLVTKSCLILCEPMDQCPPGSSLSVSHTKILEWAAISFSRDLLNPKIKPVSPAWPDFLPLSCQRSLQILLPWPVLSSGRYISVCGNGKRI